MEFRRALCGKFQVYTFLHVIHICLIIYPIMNISTLGVFLCDTRVFVLPGRSLHVYAIDDLFLRKGMRGVAAFYAQQGRLHSDKLKEANMRAAQQIVDHK